MKTIWNQKRMEELLIDFHKITHLRVGLFHTNGDEMIGYPQQSSSFCKMIRRSKKGLMACKECDQSAYRKAAAAGEYYIYHCHAGLTEMIIPIRGKGMVLGYLMIGQFRSQNMSKEQLDALKKYWESLGNKAQYMIPLYEDLPVLDEALIKACAHILQACAVYVWMEDYIRIYEEPLGKRIEGYMVSHLDQKITLEELMKVFHVGKTTLCNCVRKECGRTVSELLRFLRIEEAKKMLQNSKMAVSEVARQVGIGDYNYFSKVFKLETGQTPSDYRRQFTDSDFSMKSGFPLFTYKDDDVKI